MKKTIILIIISLQTILLSVAQNGETGNIVGTNHFIYSEILGEERHLQVYLPKGYTETDKKYTVLYLLDGQRFFLYGLSLNEYFTQFNLTPEFIIVGINNSYPQRFTHFAEGTKFTEFIGKEVLPYIDRNFRTNNENLLFGWEFAGSLGFHILTTHPALFKGYFLASPYPINDKVEALDSISELNKALYFSVSPYEFKVTDGANKLDSLLSSKNIGGLDWHYFELEDEEHRSTAYTTLYHSLRRYFRDFPEFQEDVLQKFLDAGGLDYAYAYAKERGRKYGLSSDLSSWSKYTIIRSAIRANEYGHFQTFVNEFLTDEFIGDLKYSRTLDIVGFYEKKQNHKKAIEIYKVLHTVFPDSEDILKRIGNAYMSLDNNDEAEKYFQRAKEISKSKKVKYKC